MNTTTHYCHDKEKEFHQAFQNLLKQYNITVMDGVTHGDYWLENKDKTILVSMTTLTNEIFEEN